MKNKKQRIEAALHKRFPNNDVARDHYGGLLCDYAESGLNPPHLAAEIETGDEGKLWSNIWEAMLYRHLRSMGYALRNSTKASGQHGPDFGVDHQGQMIWIEAVVPSPEGIPAEWLEPQWGVATTMPHEKMLLRCTSAVTDKQKKFADYLEKGVVGPNDRTVIAVNICRLSDLDLDGNGISQFPLVMEAVFPIGPLEVYISPDGKLDGPASNSPRFSVKKQSGREVETDRFLDPRFANVSAVVQAHQKDMHEKDLVLSTIHNPLATQRLPTGLFGVYKEFVAEPQGDGYDVKNIAPNRLALNSART